MKRGSSSGRSRRNRVNRDALSMYPLSHTSSDRSHYALVDLVFPCSCLSVSAYFFHPSHVMNYQLSFKRPHSFPHHAHLVPHTMNIPHARPFRNLFTQKTRWTIADDALCSPLHEIRIKSAVSFLSSTFACGSPPETDFKDFLIFWGRRFLSSTSTGDSHSNSSGTG